MGITWGDFAKHEWEGIKTGALAGWRKEVDKDDWRMRFRNVVWGGLRGGLKVAAEDASEYINERYGIKWLNFSLKIRTSCFFLH